MEVVQADHSVGETVFCKVQVGFSHVTAQETDFTALFKCEVIVEVFRKLFRGLEGKDVKNFAGPAVGKVGDIFDFRCHGLTEKPALDEADDGGNTRLGCVFHGTLLAGVIDVAVL